MSSRNTSVIYTAIFGNYDLLREPKVKPAGFDFICFSDRKISSKTWQVRVVEPEFRDLTRNARKYKILPHRYLGSYDVSIWVDGNILVRGDANILVNRYLKKANMAVYDHAFTRHRDREETPDAQRTLREQLGHLLELAKGGRVKDDPKTMKKQVDHYLADGYPDDQGILMSCILLRRHNEPDVVEAMEAWWKEVKKWSKRDQLSFNYVAWEHRLKFAYIQENVRNNEFSLTMRHNA